jgi:tRNA U34 5-methylaminomethyl-2-thiouridine-forming methyltransferase MnmC
MTGNGTLVTYSSKGEVKRALRQAGFTVKRLPGPAGKRHMLQAVKPMIPSLNVL